MARRSPASRRNDHRSRRASCAAQLGELVVHLRQRDAGRVHPAGRHRHLPRDCLYTSGRPRLGQPHLSELPATARMVSARAARMGLQLHGRPDVHSFDPGVCVRRLQISARAHLGRRMRAALVHARDGVHRPGAALRSERILGTRHRRVDRGPHSDHRLQGRRSDFRRTNHRRRNAVAILRVACVRHSGAADRLRRPASLFGAEAGNQRMADAWSNSQTQYLLAAVSGVGTRRRRAIHAVRGAKGSRLRRTDYPGAARSRRGRRTDRSQRPARSDNYPDGSAPRLFLPVAILAVRIAAAVD